MSNWWEKHELVKENMLHFLPTIDDINTVRKPVPIVKSKITHAEIDKDQLFWCFYAIINDDYDYMDSSFKKEKEFKIECIEKLRKIKATLRPLKLSLNAIEDELLNQKKITIKGLIALCLLYQKNVMYVWDRKYYEFINNSDEDINIFINKENITHSSCLKKANFYRENYWEIKNIDKPLKSITGYSRDELITIAKKLDILEIPKNKKEIYEKILEKI